MRLGASGSLIIKKLLDKIYDSSRAGTGIVDDSFHGWRMED